MPSPAEENEDYAVCPCCQAELPPKAHFCRECGASDESGWNDERWSEGQLPDDDDDFDYDEYIAREFPDSGGPPPPRGWRHQVTVIVVVLLCLSLLLWSVMAFL